MALSAEMDGIILVTRMKIVRRRMLDEVGRLLRASPALTLGFVVTDADAASGYGYGYGYGYGKAHLGGEEATRGVPKPA